MNFGAPFSTGVDTTEFMPTAQHIPTCTLYVLPPLYGPQPRKPAAPSEAAEQPLNSCP
jgi:hypothetical protein